MRPHPSKRRTPERPSDPGIPDVPAGDLPELAETGEAVVTAVGEAIGSVAEAVGDAFSGL